MGSRPTEISGAPRAGPHNRVTDVPGILVGNADDALARTGVTVLLCERPMVAAVDVRGGGPGTRETDALGLAGSVDTVDAVVLSGGSAFGLAAASGVQASLAKAGRGFAVGPVRVPIVPQAILFDMLNGGDLARREGDFYARLGMDALSVAGVNFALGSAGAGFGATIAGLRGGLGSASIVLTDGTAIGALAAVNAVGSVTIGDTWHFWAGGLERNGEFGGRGLPNPFPADAAIPRLKGGVRESTTIAVVATDARLDKRQCHRLAVMAQTGLARAIFPVHTPLDGDVVFAISTGDRPLTDPFHDLTLIGAAASNTLARAIARAVYEAAPSPDARMPPSYRERFA